MVDCSNVIITERYRGQNPWNMRWISSSFMLWVFISKETYGTSLVSIHWMVKPFDMSTMNHPRNTRKNPKDDFETMVKPWLGRDIHGFHPAGLTTSQLKWEVPCPPPKNAWWGTSWYLNLIVFFCTQNAVFCSKQHAPFVFFRFELNLER